MPISIQFHSCFLFRIIENSLDVRGTSSDRQRMEQEPVAKWKMTPFGKPNNKSSPVIGGLFIGFTPLHVLRNCREKISAVKKHRIPSGEFQGKTSQDSGANLREAHLPGTWEVCLVEVKAVESILGAPW